MIGVVGIGRSSRGERGRNREHHRDVDVRRNDHDLWPGKVAKTDALIPSHDDRAGDITKLRAVLRTMDGGGEALPTGISAKFSHLLGSDLSGVRIHTSGTPSDHAAAMSARAFTHGTHIAFAPGAFDAASAETDHVLAHELVHVVQNMRSGGPAMHLAARLDVGPSGTCVELEAEAGAHALTAGHAFQVSARGSLPGISLFTRKEPVPAPSGSAAPTAPAAPAGSTAPTPAASTPGLAPVPAGPTAAPPAPAPGPAGPTVAPGRTPPPPGPSAPGRPTAGPAPTPAPSPAPNATAASEPKTLDGRIAQILEQRADPTAKTTYQKGIGQVQALRLQALQYSFQKSGFGNTLFQTLVFPTDAIADHWSQIYKTNSYRGGNGNSFVDGLQATIEGFRGVMHIIGDLAAIISAWAGMVAIGAALIALIGAETGVLAIVGGAIAAIADSVSIMAGLLKILLDSLDVLLGLVQMIILVIRARSSKDPGERARFAQLLHKEAGDMAANVVLITMQVTVLVVTAGVGTGMTKGISKMFTKDFGRAFGVELGKLLNPTIVFKGGLAGIAEKFATKQVGKGVKAPMGGKTVAVAAEDVLKLNVLKRVAGRRVTKDREVVPFTTKNQMNGARLVRCNAALKKIAAMDFTAIPAGGLTASTIIVQSKAPNPAAISTPGSAGGAKVPEKVDGAMTTVGVWPSLLEQFANAKAPLGDAMKRTEKQYEHAKAQAGPELAAQVDAKLKEVSARSKAQKAAATNVAGDASEGKASSDKGADTANRGNTEKAKAEANQGKLDSETNKVQGQGANLKPPPPKDGILGTLYNVTIGKIGGWIGGAQTWLKNVVGKAAMAAAGFSKEDLDLAGIEQDMRTDSTKDTESEAKAKETQANDDPVMKAVYELMVAKTSDQQAAIQGMAESKGLIEALEEADRTLDEAIKNGHLYIEDATAILQHELETQAEGKAIDGAYIAPVLGYADAFVASIDEDTTAIAAQSDGNNALSDMQTAFSGLDTGPGRAKIASIVTTYKAARASEVAQAKAGASTIKTQVTGFIGTTDYAGVNANAQALDQLAHDFDAEDAKLGDELYRQINLVLKSYVDAIEKAVAEAMAAPETETDQSSTPAPNATPSAPPSATPNATPNAPTGGNHVAKVAGSHGKLSGGPGDATPVAAPAGAAAPATAKPGNLSIKSNTTATAAAGGNERWTVGVGEEVTFSAAGGESGDWTATGGTPGTATGPSLVWSAPGKAGQFQIQLKVGTSVATKSVAVITPMGVKFTVNNTYGPGSESMMGAGMELDMQLQPLNVSFTNATIREQPGGASGLSGYFKSVKADLSHKPSTERTRIRDSNKTGSYDDAHLMDDAADPWPKPLKVGSMTWHIPYLYTAADVTDASFVIVAQTMGIVDARGTVTVTKGSASTSRTPKPALDATRGVAPVARKADGGDVSAGAATSLAAAEGSPGGDLPATARVQLESHSGVDLSSVRVHTGSASQAAASAVGAKAYTVGQDIHFGAGYYDPSSQAGKHLLAHEVAHTIQQRGGSPERQHKLEVTTPGDQHEVEADQFADSLIAGTAGPASVKATGRMIAREVLPGTNPSEHKDTTGAVDTKHRPPTVGDATNAPAVGTPPAVVAKTANVKVIAPEAAPLKMPTGVCPNADLIYKEEPGVSPAPAGLSTVTGIQGTVDAPMVDQFADPAIFIAGAPSANDVAQGGIGDCFFMAVMMNVAARDPGHIKTIMAPDGKGGASVTLYRKAPKSGGFWDWVRSKKPEFQYIPVVVSVSEDLAVTIKDNKVFGAALYCAPAAKQQEYFSKVTGANLEIHRKDTFEVARWAPLLEKAYARYTEKHGEYGGAHDAPNAGNPAGGSGYNGINGGVSTLSLSVLYGAAAEGAAADVKNNAIDAFPTTGNVVTANAAVVDQLCLIAGRGPEAAPGDTNAPMLVANTAPDAQVLNLEKAIPLAVADPDYATLPATVRANVTKLTAAITAWKALPPDVAPSTAKATALKAVGEACVEVARTPNHEDLANLRSWAGGPVQFANKSDVVPASRESDIKTVGSNMDIMSDNGTLVPFELKVTGHASAVGDAASNQTLSENRANNVLGLIKGAVKNPANLTKNKLAAVGVGTAGASTGAEWRKAEIVIEHQTKDDNPLLASARSAPVKNMVELILNVRNIGTDHSGGQRNVYAGHGYAIMTVAFMDTAGAPVALQSVTGAQRAALLPNVDAGKSRVKVRNPHHGNEPDKDGMNHDVPGDGTPAGAKSDGIFTMTLDQFFRNFNTVGSGVLPKT